MSEREELIKLLTDTAGYLRDTRNHAWPYVESGQQFQDMLNIAARIDSTLSALAAQQSQEPVAKVKRNSGVNGREFVGETLEFRDLPVGTRLYTAPLSGVRAGYAQKQLNEIVQVMRDNGIETPGWIEHGGVKDTLTVSATLLLWFDALKAGDIQKQADSAIQRITRAADQVNADQPADAVVVPSDEELSALSLDSWERKYHKVRKEISLITWEEVYKRAYVEGFLAAQEGK